MSRLELVLWGINFVGSAVGWIFGGSYVAILFFCVGGVLILFGLLKHDQGADVQDRSVLYDHTNKPLTQARRLRQWHKLGAICFGLCAVALVPYWLIKASEPRIESSDFRPRLEDTGPFLSLSPEKLTFRGHVGKSGPSQILTLTNRSDSRRFISLSLTGNFTETNDCPGELEIGDSCTIEVSFVPTQKGYTYGNITISGTDPLNLYYPRTVAVDISGYGEI